MSDLVHNTCTFLVTATVNMSKKHGCVFCDIAHGETNTEIIYKVKQNLLHLTLNEPAAMLILISVHGEMSCLCVQDDKFVAFRDIKPAAKHHYLICPVEHIKDPKHLQRCSLEMRKFTHKHNVTCHVTSPRLEIVHPV